jgi:hypothetical protein
VVEWLERGKWDVFQEVRVDGVRADIVALTVDNGGQRSAWVVECKRNLTLDVLAQAWRWRRLAKWVSVAVPDGPKFWTDGRKLAFEILEWKGIGCIPVGEAGVMDEDIKLACPTRNADSFDLIAACRPEHKTRAAAGSNTGGYHTEFKETLARLEAFVRENPGVEMKMAAKLVDHHYRGKDPAWAFRVNIERLMKTGVIKSIRGEERGGVLCLFPAQASEPVVESPPAG